ncbi:peptide transporter [Tenacibaculum sp. SZ-18]|uniref:ABC transporter permease n=1 Tax=Tenacibaculum sp. SZ-18 TaxID=754423 RepID=UPI000C2D1ACF|nr:ABC transporter permease [Tenacibaculum sp. SZ-18]AUC14028.1 peptide transporter [Tenacibaculum sp. SZ-18]
MKSSNSLWNLTLRKFKKNKTGVFSFFYIILCGLVALFCYALAPDNSNSANQMHIEIHSKDPGFSTKMLTLPNEQSKESNTWISILFNGKKTSSNEIPILSYEVSEELLSIKKYDGTTKDFKLEIFQYSPENFISEKTFLLGTDKFGRDLISRILIGTRISFSIGFIAVLISLLIGIPIGGIAGYFGGRVDAFIMWLINITWSIPTLLLVIAITLTLGKGFWQVFIAVGLTMWVEVARIVRGQVITTKQQQYIEAAKALGYSHSRIIFKHILPNILAPIIVISAANFAAAILIESGLSFLGIGAQPPTPSWGAIIKNHYNYIILGKPFLALAPGFAIMSLVMAFMLLGNSLRDALDVKA